MAANATVQRGSSPSNVDHDQDDPGRSGTW